MRVLLTGAAGFIGSQVAAGLLARGHDVHAVVRPSSPAPRLAPIRRDLTLWETDLPDPVGVVRAVVGAAPEAVVHLAWYTEPKRYLHDRPGNLASVAASASLLGELVKTGCRRVLLGGTCLEAGAASASQPFYAAAKRAVHRLAGDIGRDRLSVACGHVFSVYGPGEHEARAIPSVTRALLAKKPIDVTEATQLRDYMHVADVAAGLCAVLESETEGGVDICSGLRRPLRELFHEIGEATGAGHLIRWGAVPVAAGEDFDVIGDPRPLEGLGWTPSYSLSEGIRDTVAWWEAQRVPAPAGTKDR